MIEQKDVVRLLETIKVDEDGNFNSLNTWYPGIDEDYKFAIGQAIKALKREQQEVIYSGDGYADGMMVYDIAECPSCGYKYEDSDKDWGESFCPHCGQSLKWEE